MCTMKVMLGFALLAASAIYMASADLGIKSPCCTKVSKWKPGPEFQLERYYIQNRTLPCVRAVIFLTQTNQLICSNPDVPWVHKKIEELSKKEEENQKTKSSGMEH